MSPGQKADRALTLLHQASGVFGLTYMVGKRQLTRSGIESVIKTVEEALSLLRSILEDGK